MIKEEYINLFPLEILIKVNHLDNVLKLKFEELYENFVEYDNDTLTTWEELVLDAELCKWLCDNIDKDITTENAAAKLLKCLEIRNDKVEFEVESIPLLTIKLIDP